VSFSFDALVALGMLQREQGRYANTPATDRYLDRVKPSYIGGMLENRIRWSSGSNRSTASRRWVWHGLPVQTIPPTCFS
jgi:hypothetical protein